MNFLPSFNISIMALKSHKMRTFLASLGVVIGIASVIIMVSIGRGSEKEVMDVIENMGQNLITVNAGEMKIRGGRPRFEGNVTTLTSRDANKIAEEVPGVEMAVPFEYKQMQVKFGNSVTDTSVGGSTTAFMAVRNYSLAVGRFFDDREVKTGNRVAVIGQTTLRNLFGHEDPLGQIIRIKSVPFQVIGVFDPKGLDTNGLDQDDLVVIPFTTLMRRVLNQTHITAIYVRAVSRGDIAPVTASVGRLLRELHKLPEEKADDFTVISQLDLEKLKGETSRLFTRLIVGVAAISLVVGGIGILAVMLISVKERTREIGVRRAVGATKGHIIRQFLIESVLIGILGGGVGVMVGVGTTWVLQRWGHWTLILELWSVGISFGVCLVIGIVFGLFPAFRASKLDPMEALTVE